MDEQLAFEGAVEKLEGIVRQLEEDSTALDDSLELFEDGVKLSRYCSKKLDDAERKVLTLIEGREGTLTAEPMDIRDDQDR